MQRDIRKSALYQEAEALFMRLRQPGTGTITDAAEAHASPDGRYAVFAGTLTDKLEGLPATRICLTDLESGDTCVLTFGPNVDRLPKFSPDGRHIAFLSDRLKAGDFQLFLLDRATGSARATPAPAGWVEYLHWSPNGRRLLLGVAGRGADVSGGQGAVTSKTAESETPAWLPSVAAGQEAHRWRRAWVYDVDADAVRQVSPVDLNIWEASWCGNDTIAAVASPGPDEGLWYSARLYTIDMRTGECREIHAPDDQLGWPSGAPSGRHLAVVDALCSDRWIVAGRLVLIDTASGRSRAIDTLGVDITSTDWRSDQMLLLAGHRGFETVVLAYDLRTDRVSELWRSTEISSGGFYVTVSGLGTNGDCVMVGETFTQPPQIAVIRAGRYRAVRSFDAGGAEAARIVKSVARVTWKAPDGLEIEGWLLLPHGQPPYPLTMSVHGGPVGHWRPRWFGRWSASVMMLLARGVAFFFPNPRGSSGRGKAFVRPVYGDMGGVDARDLLSGLDALIERGVADRHRLGVTGGSYGGFMTSWLITQDTRFAAAVAMSPHNNQVTEHLLSNIPQFMSMLLQDRYDNPGGKYFERSPVMFAHNVRTPTLHICGALDRCTPPEEAAQFHSALVQHGVESVLVTYPDEGHGVRKLPAAIDVSARVVGWFEDHLLSRRSR